MNMFTPICTKVIREIMPILMKVNTHPMSTITLSMLGGHMTMSNRADSASCG